MPSSFPFPPACSLLARALAGAACATCALALAQSPPPIAAPIAPSLPPPIATWRAPTLQVQGGAAGADGIAAGRRRVRGRRRRDARVLAAAEAEVTVRLRDAAGAVTTRVLPVRAGRNTSRLAAVQWERLALASLEGKARTNKVRIRELGQRFGLATRKSSLIVLEQIDDYVRHEIEPLAEPRVAYDLAAASQAPRRQRCRAAGAGGAPLRGARRLVEPPFPEGQPAGVFADRQVRGGDERGRLTDGAARAPSRAHRRATGGTKDNERDSSRRPTPAAAPGPSGFAAQAGSDSLSRAKKTLGGSDGDATTTTISIAVAPAAAASGAIKRLQAAGAEDWARIYVNERRANDARVGFFLGAAEFFLAEGDRHNRAFGLRVLSNLVELTCRTARRCACSPIACSRSAKSKLRCRCSSACGSSRRTSRSRTAISASRSPTPARRRRPSSTSMPSSPAPGTFDSPTSTCSR